MKVIPRDLFNDGNLLNNYGNLYIKLESEGLQGQLMDDTEDFEITTDNSSGATYISNVSLYSSEGVEICLYRPLNSRETYSLWFSDEEDDYEVFNSDGELTIDIINKIKDIV